VDFANKFNNTSRPLFAGFPSIHENKEYKLNYDNSKGVRLLGIKYHTKEETTKDTLEEFARRGLWT